MDVFRVVGLPDLSAETYAGMDDPLAVSLSALMRSSQASRVMRKLQLLMRPSVRQLRPLRASSPNGHNGEMICPLCSPSLNVVARNDLWTMVVNDDQGYLGRCYFALNRHETDVTKLAERELVTLWKMFAGAKEALDRLWQPDHYNYVFLMNVQPHLHGHIIPRYATDRVFASGVYRDGELGSHYSLTNTKVPGQEILARIADEIRAALPTPSEVS